MLNTPVYVVNILDFLIMFLYFDYKYILYSYMFIFFLISDFSMPLIQKDFKNMETQIKRILYHEISISGNLSNVQNVLHDLHGI